MKTKMLALLTVFMLGTVTLFAQEKTESFKVYGNCGMCESRIEKAAKSVEGVTTADWDQETQMMKVTYDSSKTDVKQIQKAIADAGHDTDVYRADDETYADLPGCCHYDRAPEKKE